MRNRAFTDTFEPGSTMKPFTAALALEKGKFRFDTPIQTAPGRLTIGTATIHDAHVHGMLTVAEVIQKSSNVGAAKMALSLPPEDMWQMFNSLGFGSPLKLGFPGEVGGRLRPAKTWRPIEQATMSYGHGISVTLMQLARAYLAFARDGDLMPLSLTRVETPPLTGTPVFSGADRARGADHAGNGRASRAARRPRRRFPAIASPARPAPRTSSTAAATRDKYVASFVGFAPASDPRLIVAVMIDEPSASKYYGGDVAAPVFAQVMAGALRTLGVPQDAPLKPLIMAEAVKEGDVSAATSHPRRTRARRRQGEHAVRRFARRAPGDVFVAMPGHRSDGRTFVADAVARGAAAVLLRGRRARDRRAACAVPDLDRLAGEIAHLVYGRPSERLWLAGVTGTNGKTSVSQWIAQAMGARPPVRRDRHARQRLPRLTWGERQHHAGRHRLHRQLARSRHQGAVACAMEVSSIGLDQGRVNGAQFEVAVIFTNLTRDLEQGAIDAALVEADRGHFHRAWRGTLCPRTAPAGRCKAMASGVVLTLSARSPGKPAPTVPMTAHLRPSAVRAWAIHCDTEVLPLVPVTPASHSRSDGRP